MSERERKPNPPRSPQSVEEAPPTTWADEGGAGDYPGGPVTSSGTRKRKGPPGSKS
jgi:hypothetical protein